MNVIVAFSDVHGNTPALRAFLLELVHLHPDLVVNLGDIVSGGVDPRGTLELLDGRPDFVTVRGNHERQLATGDRAGLSASDRLAFDALAPDTIARLGSLPERVEVAPGVLAFHGSPTDDRCYLLETVAPGEPNGLREATDLEVLERLGDDAGRYDVFLCGHTHLQRVRHLSDGSVVINPGSLGWPAYYDDDPTPHRVEAGSPEGRYTVLRSRDTGWAISQRRLAYDVEAAAAIAELHGRDDVAYALRTGRVGPIAPAGNSAGRPRIADPT